MGILSYITFAPCSSSPCICSSRKIWLTSPAVMLTEGPLVSRLILSELQRGRSGQAGPHKSPLPPTSPSLKIASRGFFSPVSFLGLNHRTTASWRVMGSSAPSPCGDTMVVKSSSPEQLLWASPSSCSRWDLTGGRLPHLSKWLYPLFLPSPSFSVYLILLKQSLYKCDKYRTNTCLSTAHIPENPLVFTCRYGEIFNLPTSNFLQRLATSLIKNVNPASNLKFSGLSFQAVIPVMPSAPVKVTFYQPTILASNIFSPCAYTVQMTHHFSFILTGELKVLSLTLPLSNWRSY